MFVNCSPKVFYRTLMPFRYVPFSRPELLGAELVPMRGERPACRLVGELEHSARGLAGLHTP